MMQMLLLCYVFTFFKDLAFLLNVVFKFKWKNETLKSVSLSLNIGSGLLKTSVSVLRKNLFGISVISEKTFGISVILSPVRPPLLVSWFQTRIQTIEGNLLLRRSFLVRSHCFCPIIVTCIQSANFVGKYDLLKNKKFPLMQVLLFHSNFPGYFEPQVLCSKQSLCTYIFL